MATIRHLVENKTKLQYDELCRALIEQFAVREKVNWESLLPHTQQQELFGGEVLRLVSDHPKFSDQKDIRPIALMKGTVSQLLFFFVRLEKNELPKSDIQRLTTRFIRGSEANRFIIWFFGNKSETELKVVLSGKEGKKVVLKTLPFGINQPYYKTYDFILRAVADKVSALFLEPTDLWKALWSAFDISIINRNFYNEIKDAFEKLVSQLNKKGNPFSTDEDRVQFAIRLIGRIIFCWFLKRKEVLKDEAVSSAAVKNQKQENYYHSLLELLFFDVLNTPERERRGGIPKVIAHYPFLNGGLFEAQETDYKDNFKLSIDNEWFQSFFGNTLEKYNFTVDENSSSNAEIAIDPEMLGRIFENLLAEQNPETGESARKATGSFYTPREIVDYMVEQSVSEYLKSSLALSENLNEAIEDFVHTQHLPEQLKNLEKDISDKLKDIKVLDPACGSGAFPIGVLQKVVALKQQLHPKTKNYKLKLDTIQNSIYGVDIQPMAVELSRLRCWLSLVVDEEPNDIKALPNLDFKFVCADALKSLPELKQIRLGTVVNNTVDVMKEVRNDFFMVSGKEKKKLEKQFTALQKSLFKNILDWHGKSDTISMLATWMPFENHRTTWFDTFWMFGLNSGFDIIIANPPYKVISADNRDIDYYKANYRVCKGGKVNLYKLFFEQGLTLLKRKGILCYISPSNYLTSGDSISLREILIKENNIKEVIDYEESDRVFESVTQAVATIVVSKEQNKKGNFIYKKLEKVYELASSEIIKDEKLLIKGTNPAISKIKIHLNNFDNFVFGYQGEINVSTKKDFFKSNQGRNDLPLLRGNNIGFYELVSQPIEFCPISVSSREHYHTERIVFQEVSNAGLERRLKAVLLNNYLCGHTTNYIISKNPEKITNKFLLGLINSALINYYFKFYNQTNHIPIGEIKSIPVPNLPQTTDHPIETLVDLILFSKSEKSKLNEYVPNEHIAKLFTQVIDACVYELYFPDDVKSKEGEVIELLKEQFDQWITLSKIEKVKSTYQILRDGKNEINSRVTRQKLIEEIQIITDSK